MKKIITMILTLAIAVSGIVTGTLSLGTDVKAADGYYGYNTYADYYEAYVLSQITDARKVNANDTVYTYDTNGYRKLKYYESLTEYGWIIPEDCVELLVRGGYNAYIGYKADGTKVVICNQSGMNAWGYNNEGYDKEGYDVKGYDKDGYDRNGYNKDGYDKDGYNEDGYDKDGYDKDGYDKKDCKKGEKPIAISKKIFGDFAKK